MTEFQDQYTVFATAGQVWMMCASHMPFTRSWLVGYRPSLDVLIKQARQHDEREHQNRLTATCPMCRMTRSLPPDWQDIILASLPDDEQQQWDHKLRCRNDHDPEEMIIT
jgi:hypothetical protein